MPTLYLIRGVSGSGKSTLASTMKRTGMIDHFFEADAYFYNYDGAYFFEPEKLRVAHRACSGNAKLSLLEGKNVAVSNTSTTEKEVEVYRQIAVETGATFVSIVLENRSSTESIHSVPNEVLEKQRKRFTIRL